MAFVRFQPEAPLRPPGQLSAIMIPDRASFRSGRLTLAPMFAPLASEAIVLDRRSMRPWRGRQLEQWHSDELMDVSRDGQPSGWARFIVSRGAINYVSCTQLDLQYIESNSKSSTTVGRWAIDERIASATPLVLARLLDSGDFLLPETVAIRPLYADGRCKDALR